MKSSVASHGMKLRLLVWNVFLYAINVYIIRYNNESKCVVVANPSSISRSLFSLYLQSTRLSSTSAKLGIQRPLRNRRETEQE